MGGRQTSGLGAGNRKRCTVVKRNAIVRIRKILCRQPPGHCEVLQPFEDKSRRDEGCVSLYHFRMKTAPG